MKGIFDRSQFTYDPAKDNYICPANQVLPYRFNRLDDGLMLKRYWVSDPICRAFELKSQCSTNNQSRRIDRWEHQGQVNEMDQLMVSKPDSMRFEH